MPYKAKGKCVYKKTKDGKMGAKVGCTKGDVKQYLKALYANDPKAAKDELKEIVEAFNVGKKKEELDRFYILLDFNYNNGYGSQHMYGRVWLTYGAWLERWEYDGSEGWDLKTCPMIPDYLRKNLDK